MKLAKKLHRPKGFRPFTLIVDVEAKEELAVLLACFNQSGTSIIHNLKDQCVEFDLPSHAVAERVTQRLFDYVHLEANEL